MVVTLIAIKAHSYGGQFRKVGDVYSAPRSDARVLKALRKAADASAPQTYQTQALTPEPINETPRLQPAVIPDTVVEIETPEPEPTVSIDPEPAPDEPRPRRRYRRRDMTAEGDDQA